jgi:long-chain fatty acid transport protein
MTRIIAILVILIASFFLVPVSSQASRLNQEDGIMPNHSAEFVRTLNRNASTSADAAFYNPAGLAFLGYKGLTVMFSTQTYYAKRIHTMDYYGIKYNSQPMIPTSNMLNPMNGLPDEYTAETLAPVVPDLSVIWKEKDWAVFLHVGIMQAAPGMTFPQGLAVLDWGIMAPFETTYAGSGGVSNDILGVWRNAKAVRTEYYIGGTVGGVYKITEWVAAALGIRYIYATGNQNITVKYAGVATETAAGYDVSYTNPWLIDVDVSGHGAGIIAGFHFRPVKIVDIGIRYEYYPPMILKKVTNKFMVPGVVASSGNLNIFLDGAGNFPWYDTGFDITKMTPEALSRYKKEVKPELKVTYPQTLSLGTSVCIWKGLRAEVSGELQFRHARDLDGRENNFRTLGYRFGGSLEWTFLPKATVSVGYLYTDFGVKPKARNEVDPLLRNHMMGGGFTFGVNEWLDITVGGFYAFYIPESVYNTEYTNVSGPTYHAINKTFDESRMSIGIGFTVKLFGKPVDEQDADMTIKLLKK